MNQKKYYGLVLYSMLSSMMVFAQEGKQFSAINPMNLSRQDELVVLKRTDIEKRVGLVPKFLKLTKAGKELLVQHDDLNADGKWDELVFLYSFKPGEKAFFTIARTNTKSSIEGPARAHVRLMKKNADDSWGSNIEREEMPLKNPATDFSKQPLPLYLTEGPAWENDKLAFRLYFDVRNGKDIFGKRTQRMVMDSVGKVVEPSYHNLADWGMDVLHAGKSLGSGALAFSVADKTGKDSLIRLGGDNITRTVYQRIADGPVRAIYKITYDWQLNGKPVSITDITSIWGGQYFYESNIMIRNALPDAKLVTGIASFYSNIFQSFNESGSVILLSYGKQSENKDYLGMAIMVPSTGFSYSASAPNENSDILNTYYVAQKITELKPVNFRFYAGWEKTDGRFSELNYFKDMLKTESQKLAHPIQIKW